MNIKKYKFAIISIVPIAIGILVWIYFEDKLFTSIAGVASIAAFLMQLFSSGKNGDAETKNKKEIASIAVWRYKKVVFSLIIGVVSIISLGIVISQCLEIGYETGAIDLNSDDTANYFKNAADSIVKNIEHKEKDIKPKPDNMNTSAKKETEPKEKNDSVDKIDTVPTSRIKSIIASADSSIISSGDYNKAIELKPDDAVAYINMGSAYTSKRDYNKAIECYQKAIKLKPDFAVAYNNMGIAYEYLGEQEKANDCFQKASIMRDGGSLLDF